MEKCHCQGSLWHSGTVLESFITLRQLDNLSFGTKYYLILQTCRELGNLDDTILLTSHSD